MTTYCDGTAAKAITELDVDTKRSGHIDIRCHYVRELVQIGEIAVEWVAASLMVADILTKSSAGRMHYEATGTLEDGVGGHAHLWTIATSARALIVRQRSNPVEA